MFEHILVAESEHGLLREWETVHHINEIKTDNRPDNLFVCDRSWHDRAHGMTSVSYRKQHNNHKGKPCEGCGRVFYGAPYAIKRRKYCQASCRRKIA
jgi:HNH endonuclease